MDSTVEAPAWPRLELRAIAELRRETINPADAGDVPYIGLEHLDPGDPRVRRHGSPAEVRRAKTRVRAGDVLFAKLRPYLDKSALAEWDGIASTDILVIVPDAVDGEYLSYYLHTPEFLAYAVSTQTGVNHPRTSWSSLSRWVLPVPPRSEQRRIANSFRAIFEARRATEKIVSALRQLKQSLTSHVLAYGPVPIGRAGEVVLQSTGLGAVPEHWRLVRLGDVASIDRGRFTHRPRNDPAFYGGDTPFIQTGDITAAAAQDGYVRTYTQTLNEKGLAVSRVFPKGTLAITIAANIGHTAILDFDGAFPDSIIAIEPNELTTAEFLNYFLMTQQEEMDRKAPRGTQKNINIQFLRPWPVKLPPLDEQQAIVEVLRAIDIKLAAESQRQAAQTQVLRSTLAELMCGQRRFASSELADA